MKYFLIFLTSLILGTNPIMALSHNQIKNLFNINPIYPSFSLNPGISLESWCGGNAWNWTYKNSKNDFYNINIRNYADSVSDFLKYYSKVTFDFTALSGSSGFDRNQYYYGPMTFSISSSNSSYNFFDWSKSGAENQASNNANVNLNWNNNILNVNFSTSTWVYKGLNSSWTDSTANLFVNRITFNSKFDINKLHNNLQKALTNKPLDFISDYSGDILDPNNITDPSGKGNDEINLIKNIIKNILGNDYSYWESYIEPFAFNSQTNSATVTIDINKLDSSQAAKWFFSPKINVTLSQDYWSKNISKRLHFFPGKIVNPDDSTQGMIVDEPEIIIQPTPREANGGKLRYHTALDIEFDGTLDNSEYLTINNTSVPVLNDKFKANLIDNRVNGNDSKDAPSEYKIEIFHEKDLKYTVTIDVNSLTPNLQLKWYAWNPDKNPDQKTLITSTLPNGKPNPRYDSEINKKTGTKTQIIWVKRKSALPSPLDPLDQSGDVIKNSNDYDLGYIAEGAVTGMGANQTFDVNNIRFVNREGADNNLLPFSTPNQRQKQINITSDSETDYWSDEGIWHYNEVLKDEQSVQKYIVIGAKYQNNYPRFLDVLNNNNIAVDFWTTIHGVHLKNYLYNYLNFDSSDIQKLTYEQMMTYWNQYVSDIVSQRIPPEPIPDHHYNLNGILLEIKMNQQEVSKILTTINSEVALDINKFVVNAKIGIDYNIYLTDGSGKDINVDYSVLSFLLNDKTVPQYLKLNVKSIATSILLTGQTYIQVRNSSSYDPTKVDDLSKIKFNNYQYNFSQFNIEQLNDWIIKNINNYLTIYKYLNLKINDDYGITDSSIPPDDENHNNTPGDLSDKILQRFISNDTGGKLTIIIYANDNSDLAVGQSYFMLYNNKDFPPAPPTPPLPPNHHNTNRGNNASTLWIISILVILIITSGLGYYIYRIRKYHGLPGLKKSTKKKLLLIPDSNLKFDQNKKK